MLGVLQDNDLFQGQLIANHLPKEDLLDISLYLQYYHLLSLTSGDPVGEVVVWKEVFPTRRHQGADEPVVAGYTEPDGRWFLLVVGMVLKKLFSLSFF